MNPPSQLESRSVLDLHEESHASPTVLLIDDDHDMHALCRHYLEKAGYHFVSAYEGAHGLELVRRESVDLILLDLKLPDKDGDAIYRELVSQPEFKHVRNVPVIALTAVEDFHSRKPELLNAGVSMYLEKPFGSRELLKVIDNVLLARQLRGRKDFAPHTNGEDLRRALEENRMLRSQLQEHLSCEKLIKHSPRMREVVERLQKVAKTEAGIYLHGERGTGKEYLARCIHANSSRAQGPFVAMDCTVLPSNMIEHELWGYEKDAFPGALHLRRGLLELAEGGTLFFDEITELDLDLQTKLLRVLQDRQFHRMGGKHALNADFRVISASVRDPQLALQNKTLRQDLFYRLNVVPISLPSLRERREDIPGLARVILQDFAQLHEQRVVDLTPEAEAKLTNYSWPGNVRELRQTLENLAARVPHDAITLADLPEHICANTEAETLALPALMPQYDPTASLREARQKWVEQFERKYLIDLLNQYNGNISRVARRAGVHRMTIYRMLKSYDITITPRRAE